MPRAGLTPQVITRAAASLIDREGADALGITRLAHDLGVRPPSLYNHIDSLEGLERRIALDGTDQLAEVCRAAVMGRAGSEALGALARAYRAFVHAHPGVYALTQRARPGDADYEARASRVLEPVVALLTAYGLPEADRVHAARSLRSAVHGFVALEQADGFGLDVDVDASFGWMLAMVERGLRAARRSRS